MTYTISKQVLETSTDIDNFLSQQVSTSLHVLMGSTLTRSQKNIRTLKQSILNEIKTVAPEEQKKYFGIIRNRIRLIRMMEQSGLDFTAISDSAHELITIHEIRTLKSFKVETEIKHFNSINLKRHKDYFKQPKAYWEKRQEIKHAKKMQELAR